MIPSDPQPVLISESVKTVPFGEGIHWPGGVKNDVREDGVEREDPGVKADDLVSSSSFLKAMSFLTFSFLGLVYLLFVVVVVVVLMACVDMSSSLLYLGKCFFFVLVAHPPFANQGYLYTYSKLLLKLNFVFSNSSG